MSWERGAILWVAGCAVVGITALYVWLLEDPMLVYLILVAAVMAVFPTYKEAIACTGLFGVYRIAVRHDTVTGGFSSFVTSVAEGLDFTVGGTGSFVMALALYSLAKSIVSFDFASISRATRDALPITGIMGARLVFQNAADANLSERFELATAYVKGIAGSFRALLLRAR